MEQLTFQMLVVLLLVTWALIVNGWTDAPNAIVTVVSTGVMATKAAVAMAVVANIAGGLSGTKVAETISQSIVDSSVLTLPAVAAAMVSVIGWGTFAGIFGIPISKSHSLVSGIAGAAVAPGFWKTFTWNGWGSLPFDIWVALVAGFQGLIWEGWKLILIGLLFSSCIGLIAGWIMVTITNILATLAIRTGLTRSTRLKRIFDRLQMISATAMAWTHGLNDTQKFAGAFVLVLVLGKHIEKKTGVRIVVPWWVNPFCALMMGVGTMLGGWRIIRTVGMRMTRLTSREGFAAEATASTILFGLANFGVPASTTHTINTSIVGVAAAKGMRYVRWDVFGRILLAWISTFFVCGVISFGAASIDIIFF